MSHLIASTLALLGAASFANAYWLMGAENVLTTQRLDPIVSPGVVSGHVHSVLGGSNFGFNITTASLRNSKCSSIPIPQDKSNYWYPHLYFEWQNGSFTSLTGGAVMYYLFSDTPGVTTAFPDDFRMVSGDPTLRTYDASSFAQQAVTFLCLDFNGNPTRYNEIPAVTCPNGVRAQINFPSCWDGKNNDSPDHKSHVSFLSTGPDSGSCSDANFPVTLPRVFMEVYWASNDFDSVRDQAKNTSQPFVFSYGDPTGYGYHADFYNGWDSGVLQKAVDNCNCNIYGDPTCCVDAGIFDMNSGQTCSITNSVDEVVLGTLDKLPGNNPVQPEGVQATIYKDPDTPAILSPVYVYTGASPTATGQVATPAQTGAPAAASPASSAAPSSAPPAAASHAPSASASPAPASASSASLAAASPVSPAAASPASSAAASPASPAAASPAPPAIAPSPPAVSPSPPAVSAHSAPAGSPAAPPATETFIVSAPTAAPVASPTSGTNSSSSKSCKPRKHSTSRTASRKVAAHKRRISHSF